MAICEPHPAMFQEVFALPDFLRDPILLIGVQEVFKGTPSMDEAFPFRLLRDCFLAKGHEDIRTVDWQDERADLKVDLSRPSDIPLRVNTIIDIGTIEHVANPHACLQNYLSWLNVGGHLFIHTPVNGHLGHGLFVFSPEYIPATLKHNGFEIVYEKYNSWAGTEVFMKPSGGELQCESANRDIITWVVGKKIHDVEALEPIQQGRYGDPT